MKRLVILFLVAVFHVPAHSSGTIEDFARGTWLTFWAFNPHKDTTYFHCIPGMTKRDPAQVDWENELDLLSRMHANRLHAWLWFQHDYMDEVCLESGGEIKMDIGADTDYKYRVSDPYPPCPTEFDVLNIGYWLWYNCYNPDPDSDWSGPVWNYIDWPDEDWQAGFSRADL